MIFLGYEYQNDEIKWKKIYWENGDETKYSVSNIGLVRNDKTDKLLVTNFSKGYERVNLTHKGKSKQYFIHRLVATAFVPNPDNKPEVNHKDTIKSHNYDTNLEWCTRSENEMHAYKNNLIKRLKKHSKRLSKKQIKKICELLEENELSQYEIACKVGCSRQSVKRILEGISYFDISHQYNIDNYEIKTDFSKKGLDNVNSKYSDEQVIEVCELIDSGKYELMEISKMTGMTYQSIRNIYYGTCRKDISKNYNFIKSNTHPIVEEKRKQVIQICELLDTGLNTREVSEKLNIPRTLIRNIYSGNTWKDISKNYNFMKNKKHKK